MSEESDLDLNIQSQGVVRANMVCVPAAELASLRAQLAEAQRERDAAESQLPSEVSWLLRRILDSDWSDDDEIAEICRRYRTDTTLRDGIKAAEQKLAEAQHERDREVSRAELREDENYGLNILYEDALARMKALEAVFAAANNLMQHSGDPEHGGLWSALRAAIAEAEKPADAGESGE